MNKDDREKMLELSDVLSKHLRTLSEALQAYDEQGELSPEDELEYAKLHKLVKRGFEVLTQVKEVLEREIYHNATAYYFEVKAKAEKGDEAARAIYDELRPLYARDLNERIHKN